MAGVSQLSSSWVVGRRMDTKMAADGGGCDSALCSAERRLVKRELLSWTKKVPVLVGLETIAEALVGRQMLGQLIAFGPVDSLGGVQPEDWNASESCSVCVSNATESKNLPDQAAWYGPQLTGILDMLNNGQHHLFFDAYAGRCGKDRDLRDLDVDLDAPLDLRRLPPHPPHPPPPSNVDEKNLGAEFVAGKTAVELKVPKVIQKSTRHPSQSGYGAKKLCAEPELTSSATANVVCSGKLCAPRGASIPCGIPRSTVRDRAFRIGSDASPPSADEDAPDFFPGGHVVVGHVTNDSCGMENSFKVERCWPTDCLEAMDQLRNVALGHHCQGGPYQVALPPPSSVAAPVQKYCFEPERDRGSDGVGVGVDPMVDSMVDPEELPFFQRLVQEFAEKQIKAEIDDQRRFVGVDDLDYFRSLWWGTPLPEDGTSGGGGGGPELKVPLYRPLLRSTEKTGDNGGFSTSPPPPHPSPPHPLPPSPYSAAWKSSACFSSFSSEPVTSSSRSNRIDRMLSDVIVKTIAEKFRTRNFGLLPGDVITTTTTATTGFGCYPDVGICPDVLASSRSSHRTMRMMTMIGGTPDFVDARDSRSTSGGSSDGEKRRRLEGGGGGRGGRGGEDEGKTLNKKTRPKRGQYRKYNRQLLLEAVKAVQKGVMSVHRAGSYYGVPHSTLEYKVKERHLLRQKKSLENSAAARATGSHEENSKTAMMMTIQSGKDSPPSKDDDESSHGHHHHHHHHHQRPSPNLPYSFRHPQWPLSSSASPSSSSGLPSIAPLPPPPQMGMLPWPPQPSLMAGVFPVSVPGPAVAFDARVPSFGFSTSASDLLKRLQQKVQANLTGSDVARRTESEPEPEPEATDNVNRSSPDVASGRSSACSIGSPHVAVS